MSEMNLNTTLLNNMEIMSCLGRKGGTAVYLVRSSKSDQFFVLKHISVPESQKQVEALRFTGAASDDEQAQSYYQQLASDYQAELDRMQSLSNSPNLVCFRSYEIKPKEEGVGFDIFLLGEYRNTLDRYLADTLMTQAGAVNLAIDLCSALSELRGAGLLHRDVTPSNIYLGSQGHFMLGDLGVTELEGLQFCSMPEQMLSPYSAPELFALIANVNETIDLYSVGLILYRIYNGNHAPFEDERTSAKAADRMRITGQALPAPMFADYEMAEILQKACAFLPEDRFQTPEEMKQAFTDYMMRNQVGDAPIIPPIQDEETQLDPDETEEEVEPVQFASTEELDETFKESFSPDNEMLNSLLETVHREADDGFNVDELDASEEDDLTAPFAPRKRKKFFKWLPTVLAVVLAVGVVATAIWFFFLKPELITIDSFELVEQTVDSLTVSVETQEDPSSFVVVCSDAYGYENRQPYTAGEPNVFADLAPGSPYTISLVGTRNVKFEGAYSITENTISTTQVISLSVNRQTVNQLELSFVVDGNEPEEWIISYTAAGQEPKTKVFSGHTVVLTGLEADTDYTITLEDPKKDIHLTGNTTVLGRTLPSVSMDELKAVLSSSTATLTWTFTGPAPESWNVTTTGTDGYSDNQTVSDSKLVLEGLQAGETYSILITCDNMEQAASTSITPNPLRITDLKATPNENGGIDVTWSTEAEDEELQWLVTYGLKGNDAMNAAEQPEEPALTLTGLIPNSTYVIKIQEATGKQLGGDTTSVEVTIPAPEPFKDYGFSSAYVSTWLCPTKEEWTVNDLGTTRNTFAPTETVAFACESISQVKDSEDPITVLVVVRDSNGIAVDHYSGEEIWGDMWTRQKYVGELLRTPQTPGKYTLELYFNGKQVVTGTAIDFTISG